MSNIKLQISNQVQMSNDTKKQYNLGERTAKFGEEIIKFCRVFVKDVINVILIEQLVRSGTSIGANYMEADAAESKRDFIHKIGICKKEAKETTYWLRMVAQYASDDQKAMCRILWQEARELTLIFSAIINSTKRRE